jgi:hypothetical protein
MSDKIPLWQAEQILDAMEARGEPMPEVRVDEGGVTIIPKEESEDATV